MIVDYFFLNSELIFDDDFLDLELLMIELIISFDLNLLVILSIILFPFSFNI